MGHSSNSPNSHFKAREPRQGCREALFHWEPAIKPTPRLIPYSIKKTGSAKKSFDMFLSILTRWRVLQTHSPMRNGMMIVSTLPRPPVTTMVQRKEKVDTEEKKCRIWHRAADTASHWSDWGKGTS